MTRASLREYAAIQPERYLRATRAEKRQLLDEVVAVTGIHRKAAIRLLRREPRARTGASRAGAPRVRDLRCDWNQRRHATSGRSDSDRRSQRLQMSHAGRR